jgi:hypothetical protein
MTKRPPMTAFVNAQITRGVTWERLLKVCQAEAQQRGIKDYQTLGALKRHARWLAGHGWTIEQTETGVRGNPLPQPEKPKPAKAQPKPKPTKPAPKAKAKAQPRKTGKATGRKVTKTTEAGRQTVSEPAPAPVAEQKPEAA